MPSVDEIRTITIKAVSDGLDKAVADINKLAAAQGSLAVVSDTSTRAQTSVKNALDKQQMSLDTNYRSQQNFNKAQLDITRGYNEGMISLDRYNQLTQLNTDRLQNATNSHSVFQKALSGVQGQLVALSAGAGPVGVALAGLGPVGLVAAAGIGLISKALDTMKEQANEAGQWAQGIQNASNVIGITTTQLQGLNEAASHVGVAANDNVAAFEKFAISLGQLRDGSGSLYTELQKVNPSLVNQLSLAKDAATGWNLLSEAYASANQQQQALIARAAFGRGGAAQGQVLLATSAAGGIGGLESANQIDAISKQQIQQWAQIKTEIDSATESAARNFQSIFTSQVLQNEKNFSDGVLEISRWAKEFAMSEDLKKYIAFFSNPAIAGAIGGALVGAAGGSLVGGIGAVPGAIAGAVAGGVAGMTVNGISNVGTSRVAQPAEPFSPSGRDFDATFSAVNGAAAAASLGIQAAQAKALVSALGGAATAQDKLDATTKQLNVDLANHTITVDVYNRAIAGANLDAAISKQNLYNSSLGEFATTADLVAAKSLSLQKAQQQGAGLTTQQITAVKNLTAANDEWSRVNGQAQIGVFNLAAAQKAAGDQFQVWIDKKYLDPNNPEQYAAAVQVMANKVQAAGEAAAVAGSKFPQLTQMGLDAGNLNKQFDTFATTTINGVSPALQDMLNGTTSLSAGFQNLGLVVVKAAENMIIQLLILKPLISAMGSALGIGGGAITLGTSAGPTPFANAHGNAFDYGNVIPFARGGAFTNSVVDSPTLFKFASGTGLMGEAGPEAIVPLKRGSDGSLGIASSGGGSAPNITFNVVEDSSRAGQRDQKQSGNGDFEITQFVDAITAKNAGNPGSATSQVLDNRKRIASR